jgi:hypothetical protein
MRPALVEVEHICEKHTMELLLLEDEQVIKTLATHTAEKAFTDGIGSRGVIRYGEHLDVTRLGNPSEAHPKLAIVITDEVLRSFAIGCGFAQRYALPMHRWETASRPHGSFCVSAVR